MKNKSELQHELEQLSIPYRGAHTKEDLMDLLAASYRKLITGAHPPLIPQHAVMLARKAKDLESDKFDDLLDNQSGLWIAEEKLDGVRAKLHLESTSNRIDSRHRSDVTYEYVEKTDCLPHLKNMRHFMPGTVLDGELLMPVRTINFEKTKTDSVLTSTTATVNSLPGRAIEIQEKVGYCRYFAFDILFHQGEDVRLLPYSERYRLLCHVYMQLTDNLFFTMPVQRGDDFLNFFKDLVHTGGEGIMLKRLDWPYIDHGRGKGWYKLPKQDRVDAFVTGFVPGEGEFSGLVGSLLISTMIDGEPVEIGAVQPGDLGFRNKISLADGSLRDEMYGKVMEVSYMCKTKNSRLRHAVKERFRPDKNTSDCTEKI